jgi:hypothetical protein
MRVLLAVVGSISKFLLESQPRALALLTIVLTQMNATFKNNGASAFSREALWPDSVIGCNHFETLIT